MSNILFDAPGPKARRRSRIISIIGIVGILALGVWVYTILAAPRVSGGVETPSFLDPSRWDFLPYTEFWGSVGRGVLATLQAAAVAAVGALILGVIFALLRSSDHAIVRVPVAILQEFLRGMPVLLMMLFILLLASTGAFWAVVIALVLYNGTLIGEALRAGLVALPRGQREAALAIGMRSLQSRMLVEFPQAFRQMLPIIVAQLVVLLKDTALGYIVAYPELIRTVIYNLGSYYGNRYLLSLFVVTLVIYLAINLSISWFARWLSRRTASGGRKAKRGGSDVDPDQAILVAQASASARQSGNAPGY
ncbi:ABC transporter permease subunit [Microbacterium invictum]|uniref:ABC transporter permease subunit n=1 Tax=Microbacterium invictum TaxID=515415 RepID=A0ABZ0V6N7_9MICO|nr:ABC transporter permease subunit [Microbacterium invictum]WQB69265.1 ABC transporter permease subunit [Microbacterium invictum]